MIRILLAGLALALGSWAFQAASPGVHPVSGRQYAHVMGVAGASWLERTERDAEENPQAAIEALGLKPGMTVCDLGAGSGYYSIRMAQRVGAQGKVYAVDIQPGMIKLLEKRIKDEKLKNIVPVLSTANDPKLPDNEIDLMILVDVYHEFSSTSSAADRTHDRRRQGSSSLFRCRAAWGRWVSKGGALHS